MTEYTVAHGPDLYELSKEVKENLSEGWELQGGVFASDIKIRPTGSRFFQAMFRKDVK